MKPRKRPTEEQQPDQAFFAHAADITLIYCSPNSKSRRKTWKTRQVCCEGKTWMQSHGNQISLRANMGTKDELELYRDQVHGLKVKTSTLDPKTEKKGTANLSTYLTCFLTCPDTALQNSEGAVRVKQTL